MRTGGAWSGTNRGKWLTSFMLCAMSTCLMIMLFFSSVFCYCFFFIGCCGALACAHALFFIVAAIMFILRLLVHKLQWPSGTNREKKERNRITVSTAQSDHLKFQTFG